MARNKELNQKMKDERKEKILLSALRLFAKKGLSATKITDIAEATEMSQGLVYHYYKSKEDIFIELIKDAFSKINNASLQLEQLPISPLERISLAIETILKNLDEKGDHSLYHLLIAQSTASEAIPDEAKKVIQNENMIPYQVISRIMAEGQKDGSIKDFDPDDLAQVFWTSIKGLAINKAVHGNKYKTPDPGILISMFAK